MVKIPLDSLLISYGIPRSTSLERVKKNEKPSHRPPGVITMHLDFLLIVLDFIFLICLVILGVLLLN